MLQLHYRSILTDALNRSISSLLNFWSPSKGVYPAQHPLLVSARTRICSCHAEHMVDSSCNQTFTWNWWKKCNVTQDRRTHRSGMWQGVGPTILTAPTTTVQSPAGGSRLSLNSLRHSKPKQSLRWGVVGLLISWAGPRLFLYGPKNDSTVGRPKGFTQSSLFLG
jgi:hypothetical protein